MRRALALAIIAHLLLIALFTGLLQRTPSGGAAQPALEIALQHTGSSRGADSAANNRDALHAPQPAAVPALTHETPAPAERLPASAGNRASLPLPGSNAVPLPAVPSALDALKREYVFALSRHLLGRPFPYPAGARKRGVEGTVIVTFSLDGLGNITAARVSASSGDAELDDAALAAVRERSPLPKPPADLPVRELEWDWPVPFRLD